MLGGNLMIRKSALAMAVFLAGCNTVPLEDTPTRAQIADSSLPPIKAFVTPHPTAPIRSNNNIAQDFLSLHFQLESGRALPVFTRFETPITVRVTGQPSSTLNGDLGRLLGRLRHEAGINITQVRSDQPANITIEAISRDEIRRALPQAACFVVPNVSSLAEFRRDRRKPRTNWLQIKSRERLGIFLPYNASPQEIRDCLHEELAQAIGPLNDLYRLPDSVFNDDNIHTVLTGFDMLILRATYAPELRTGMSREQVARILPDLLARMNPRGNAIPAQPITPTPRDWIDTVQKTFGPGSSPAQRKSAATKSVAIAQREGWQDHRHAFSLFNLGRVTQATDPVKAQQYFGTAQQFLARTPGTELHMANIATYTSAYEISRGNADGALRQINPAIITAARAENASLMSMLMLLKAEALEMQGRSSEARAVRLDSLGWARYGFGSDHAVRARMREISALNPNNRAGG